jgi:cell division septum initiation protein DivIVA
MSESLPSDVYQSIGDEIGDLLQQAHDWAERTRAEAKSEADRVTEQAAATAKRLVDEAETKAGELRAESEGAAKRQRSDAAEKAEQLRIDSEERAERVRSESEKSATKLRMSAEAYASQVRADAQADAERRLQEADARVAELRDIEAQARQRIDALMKRLLSIAEQLGREVWDDDIAEGATELEVSAVDEEQPEPTHDAPRVEVVHQDVGEPIGVESERFATGGTKT